MFARLFCCLLLTSVAFAQTELNGVATYEVLGKAYYTGALYLTEATSDPAVIQGDLRPQKMVIRVLAKRWSPRKFEQVWRQDLALNNDLSADPKLTEQLIGFPVAWIAQLQLPC